MKLNKNKVGGILLLISIVAVLIFTFNTKKHIQHSNADSTENIVENKNILAETQNDSSINIGEPQIVKTTNSKQQTIVPTQTQWGEGFSAYLATRQNGIIGAFGGIESDNPIDNIFTVSIDKVLQASDRVWLNFKLEGVADFNGIACSVNDRLSFGGYLVKKDTAVRRQRVRINAAWLKKGNNRIQFGLAANAKYGYKISDLAIEVQSNSDNTPELIVNTTKKLYNGKSYLHGFVTNSKHATVEIDGKKLELRDGEFEYLYAGDTITKLIANVGDRKIERTIVLKQDMQSDYEFAINNDIERKGANFKKANDNRLESGIALLKAPKNVVLNDTKISSTSLRCIDLPALNIGMTNVTSQKRGVRFLPHGNHFGGDGASVALKYDRTLIPDGYTENDIRTFYFDINVNQWVALERDTVNKELCMVVSKTTHFTDMINGVITTPESPETQGFAPTMMNDIKAADPTAKIQLIAPPSANNQGSANLSYPIELPPARNGMSPNLAITYNSDGGSGWLGEGWDLNVPSITVDTKFGVPTYNSKFESENYLLNGVMLAHTFIKEEATNQELDEKMFFPDRGVVYRRNKNDGDKKNEVYQFFPRIQGEFQLIERIGTQTYDYKWRVTYKNGTKFYYGYNGAVLAKDTVTNAKIAEWKLQSMVDIHGDSVAYSYSIVDDEVAYGNLKPRAIYLNKIEGYNIRFNGSNKEYLKQYEVEFKSNTLKAKKTNNARYGFLVSNQKLLDSIIVKYANAQGQLKVLRKYAFNYNTQKVLHTDLVEKVKQLDSNGDKVGEHTFNYYNNINDNKYISDAVRIPTPNSNLNQTITNNIAGSLYAGAGKGWNILSKENSIGINAGYSGPTTTGKTTIIDINGDGLGDQVYEKGNKLYFKARLANDSYSDEICLENAPKSFSRTKNNTITLGLGLYFKEDLGYARFDADLLNKSTTNAYFSDVNSDGLIDIVYEEKVYFNYISRYIGEVAVPAFTLNSNLTENPMTNKTIYDLSDRVAGLTRYESTGTGGVEYQGIEKWITYPDAKSDTILSEASPMQDLVRVWEAPYDGTVAISGNIQLLAPVGAYDTLAYELADGVRVAIQKAGVELDTLHISKSDNAVKSINLSSVFVEKGDRIYFRVQAGNKLLSNGNFDDVVWNPVVSYTWVNENESFDKNGYTNMVYKSNEGFIVNKTGYNLIDSLPNGTQVTIRSNIYKPQNSGSIKFEAFSSMVENEYKLEGDRKVRNYINYYERKIFEKTYNSTEEVNDSIVNTFAFNGERFIWFRVTSDKETTPNNVHWQKIKCNPVIEYSYNKRIEENDTLIKDTLINVKLNAGVKYELYNNYNKVTTETLFVNKKTDEIKYYLRPTLTSVPYNNSFDVEGIMVLKNPENDSVIQKDTFNISPEGISHPKLVNTDIPAFNVELYINNNSSDIFTLKVEEYTFLGENGIEIQKKDGEEYTFTGKTLVNEFEGVSYIEGLFFMFSDDGGSLHGISNDISVYSKRYDYDYGSMLRNWGYFEYNAANGRYAKPIEVDSLMLPKTEDDVFFEDIKAIPLAPHFASKSFLQGYSDNIRLSGDTMRVGRLAMDNLVDLTAYLAPGGRYRAKAAAPDPNAKYYISAPSLLTKQKNFSFSAGVDINVFPRGKVLSRVLSKLGISSLDASLAKGSFEKILDYIDMNGDGYPDYFKGGEIKYSNSRGSVTDISKIGNAMEKSSSTNIAVGCGSAIITSLPNPFKKASEFASSCNVSAGVSVTTNKLQISYLDINGDGLPDIINHENGKIALNLGYSFTDYFSAGNLEHQSTTFGANLGLGIGKDLGSGFQAGFGIASAASATDKKLVDVNGDGLVDIVRVERASGSGNNIFNYIIPNKLWVRLNTGNGFAPEPGIQWGQNVALGNTLAQSISFNAAFTFGIPFFPPAWKLVFNPSVNASTTSSYQLNDVRDYDGDGYADFLKTEYLDNKINITPIGLAVNYSNIGHTNKLKTVTNPLGGTITVEYSRSAASTDHPGGKRVMTTVVMTDGVSDDGENIKSKFEYTNGKYNRREREFNGFGEVCTRNIDTEVKTTEVAYRKTVQTFDVSSYYTKGNLLKVAVFDQQGNKKQETENTYYCYDVRTRRIIEGSGTTKKTIDKYTYNTPVITNTKLQDSIVVYSPLKYTTSAAIEGGANLITQQAFHTYYTDYDNIRTNNNRLGDLKTFKSSNKGSLLPDGTGDYDYQTEIIYKSEMTDKYYVGGLPAQVIVTDKNNKLYRNIQAHYDHVGFPTHITSIKQYYSVNNANEYATTTMQYDKYGNIIHKLLPSGMAYTYTYDDKYNMFVTQMKDTFGYTYQMLDYDYRFGIPLKTIDINGNVMTQTVDNRGRITSVTGPNEYVEGNTQKHTIKFEYYPHMMTRNVNGTINNPAYAITKHFDPLHVGDSIVTATFVDGFGRPVQVKKSAVINDVVNRTIVSGRVRYDAFGRVVKAYYPTAEDKSNMKIFNRAYNGINPTLTEYDVLDRVTKTILPDGATTTMNYGISNGNLLTTVVDAEGGKQQTYSNGSGLTVKTKQFITNDSAYTTRFEYDAINQLVVVIDDAGKKTISEYDLAGRRTKLTHPASGVSTFGYDAASNLLWKFTANNDSIKYGYKYNRLERIEYPRYPENNVTYTFGDDTPDNRSNNRVGRLVSLEDGSGAQAFKYGKQGEVTEVRRTLVIPNQAVATYVTGWKYDSWNRLLEMTYPDGEKIKYAYNKGGLLTRVYNDSNFDYVSNIKYDEFEQRTSLTYGNGAVTNYKYKPENRQMDELAVTSNDLKLMQNKYGYDKVGNIKTITNSAQVSNAGSSNAIGGGITHTYGYDKLYRLTSAQGAFIGDNGQKANYSLDMRYDNMHNITYKKQDLVQQNMKFGGVFNTGYELNYTIDVNNSQQISNIADASYRVDRGTAANYATGKLTSDEVVRKSEAYGYDANGNMLYVHKGIGNPDSAMQVTSSRRLLWDEENRLLGISDNGFVSQYWYDASGERTVKASFDNEGVYINGALSGARTGTSKFTAYVSPYLVVSNGGNYTKHVYMGSQRITSKVSNSGIFGTSPVNTTELQAKYTQQTTKIKERFDSLGVAYSGLEQSGGLVSSSPASTADKYFYHPDHLGSSSLITDGTGALVQHIQYVPFGEVFIEQRNSKWSTPYKFNGKELDEETGLAYYHARYYDPRTSVWLSVDPLAEKYPNIGSYVYCANNPVKYIDPDGKKIVYFNGYLGFGSPVGGKSYWNSGFIRGAAKFFNDYSKPYYTNIDHKTFSSAEDRQADGYEYAKQNYDALTEGMKQDEPFRLISHSMGSAESAGAKKYLEEKGWNVETMVLLNSFQSDNIKIDKSNGTIIVDYQNTNDPVLYYLDPQYWTATSEVNNADFKIREVSNEDLPYRHRDPIDSGQAFWNNLVKKCTESLNQQ